MEIKRAHWTSDGNSYRMEMPLTKVDEENRLVSGWASLDNPDLQGDIVLAEASERAFAKFRGNIREMHQPIAVGRMISYRPDSYYDSTTQKFYNGIYVTVYVSKGAQSTWEKVLDKTLQAFSIHGPIIESEMEFSKDSGTSLRVIKDYELVELSLVDSGGNQLANVMSISKSSSGITVTGMVADADIQNIFWCEKDQVAKRAAADSSSCLHCNTAMKSIGWVEGDSDSTEKVAEVVSKYINEQAKSAKTEGGVNVAEEKDTNEAIPGSTSPKVNEVVEQGRAQSEVDSSVEEVAATDESDETAKAADVSEVKVDEEPSITKMFEDLKSAFTKGLESSQAETQKAIASIEQRVVEITKSFEDKVGELAGEHAKLAEKFDGVKSGVEDVEKRINSVEDSTAVKKSGDLGGSQEDSLKKGIWVGSLLG